MKKLISKLVLIWTYMVAIPVTLVYSIIGIIITTVLNLAGYALAWFTDDWDALGAFNNAFDKMFALTKTYSKYDEKIHLVKDEEW